MTPPSTVLLSGCLRRPPDEFHHRVALAFQRLHGFLMRRHGFLVLFFLRLSLGVNRRHVFPVPGVTLLRGLSHDVESDSDEAALRGPDEGGDPHGGTLHCKRCLLKGQSGLLQCERVLLHGNLSAKDA